MKRIDDGSKITKEFAIWKEKMPSLYDLVVSRCLRWPSLTIQWLPDRVELPDGDYSSQTLILATCALEGFPNYLLLVEVLLPLKNVQFDPILSNKARVVQQIKHDREVNRARYMPQNNNIIATKTVSGDVLVFDRSNHPPMPSTFSCKPDMRLKGHVSEGFGLSWSPFREGLLLSSASDAKICLWDINASPRNESLYSLQNFGIYYNHWHEPGFEDVAWHLKHDCVFASVGIDYMLRIWDQRSPTPQEPIQSAVAHKDSVNCLAFNPLNEWLLATGSSDETVKLFDIRKIDKNALHTICARKGGVFHVEWSPKEETILASSCDGSKIMVWDLNRIGEEQRIKEGRHYPTELLFIHGGHMDLVPEFSWNPCDDWVIASVAADSIIQIWKMSEHFYKVVDDEPSDAPTTNAP